MMKLLKAQRGDTIVEVLIAIALVGIVLTASFAITSRTTGSIQQSQEHTEALKMAETQVEQLKTLTQTSDDPFTRTIVPGGGFCTFNDGGTITDVDITDPSNSCVNTAEGIDYNITITRVDNTPHHIFSVSITWPAIGGGTNQVGITYGLDH